jgi:hypothetical protein
VPVSSKRIVFSVVAALLMALTSAAVVSPAANAATAGAPAAAVSAQAVHPAAGTFTAQVDFATISLREVGDSKCLLTVQGVLTFTGTLKGAATGTTSALIFATCAQVAATPPGTYFDLFRFQSTFRGTVKDVRVTGRLTYAGITRVGGAIDAAILLDGDRADAALRADAEVAVGGSYTGVVHLV